MGKYIVELKKNETLYKATTRESDGTAYVCSAIGTPYTASDLEQVRKEAYEDGYKTAKVQCNIQAEKDLREVGERHYQKGLSDAWEAARKIRDMTWKEQIEAFGTDSYADIIALSASECIEKIRQYEQEKEMDGLRQNIQTIVDQCGYTLDEIAEVLRKMKETDNG